ncbi:jg22996 [Pararge aegeria aegeria]|uniref:Jg22996 protein n=1 Tax=Pararge aegeria aegeria TaxID=348720 RepID=A0A8S4QF93_9NEOP|nr:jg22996 [Pararge aegeria aegeria]
MAAVLGGAKLGFGLGLDAAVAPRLWAPPLTATSLRRGRVPGPGAPSLPDEPKSSAISNGPPVWKARRADNQR